MPDRKCVTFVLLILACLPLAAAETMGGRDRLERFLAGLNTLKADFRQQVFSLDTGAEGAADGTFYVRRPGLFRWEYRHPPKLVVADGDRVWLFDPELEQVSFQSQAKALRGTPAQLLVDTEPVEKYFAIRDLESLGDLAWVELRPRQEESEFEKIRLGFGFADGQLRELEMEDSFGQLTRFQFQGLERNPELEPDLFSFTPPSSFDVFGTD